MSLDINQRVLNALKEAKEKLAAVERQKSESVAIIGMAGRFPGAKNIDEYWHNLRSGINSIQFLSDKELAASGVDRDLIKNPNYVRAYSSFDDIDCFDADFFGYSPLEAKVIDPQHRIFLESAYEALENAGYISDRLNHKNNYKIGVFAGSALNSYLLNLYSSAELQEKLNNVQVVISNVMGLMPTRVSYKLNLKGASCGIQTGCSTSLVAVHLACQSLLNGESDMALAGGITVSAEDKKGYLYQEGSIASPDGYCRAFDAAGKGTIFGNGVGIVVLKRLSKAVKDRDFIWAVIKGSAINNDGGDKVGLTAPSVTGQAEVIKRALQQANISPKTISYIEAHGTGTSLGDPIELAALNKVFRHSNSKQNNCAIGSVKTNIGHLDAAAGISGLIKTVLALYHKQIPPSLNFNRPNPEIDFENSPFYVNTELAEWETKDIPRRAGVSSFGMGGTNAHVVLEEAPLPQPLSYNERGEEANILVISAKTETALDAATVNLANYLEQNPDLNLDDVAYTLQVGRKAFDYRRMVVCQDIKNAPQKLTTSAITQHQSSINRPITFIFSGQGSQYAGMAEQLYQTEPVFKENCDRCCQILEQYLDIPLQNIIFSSDLSYRRFLETSLQEINQTQYAQPAIFTIEYALAQLWMSWGIKPENAIGHSIGEYVAATIAGVFSLEDGLKVVAKRGRLMQQCPKGAMLSVAMSAGDTVKTIGASSYQSDLSLAVVNAPELCVISGTEKAIADIEKTLPQQGIACRRLYTSHGFHSAMMDGILEEFVTEISEVKLNAPTLPFISNVTGTWITPESAQNPQYWGQHLRETVNFSRGIQEVLKDSNLVLLEIGAGKTLTTLVRQQQDKRESDSILLSSLPSFKEKQLALQDNLTDKHFILNTLGKLWLAGVDIDWSNYYRNKTPYRIPLPTYPFAKKRYWVERNSLNSGLATIQAEVKPLKETKKPDIEDWFYIPSWQRSQPLVNSKVTNTEKYTCLVFARYDLFSQEVKAKLKQLNCDVITVNIESQFVKKSDIAYKINPHNYDDYISLINNLAENQKIPHKIIYLWGLSDPEILDSKSLSEFNSLIYLARALTSQYLTKPIQLSIVTNDVHQVTGVEKLNSNKAMILGACKVIPQEYPQIICHNLDLEINNLDKNRILNSLITDVLTIPQENAIAYRNNYKWQQVIAPFPLAKSQSISFKEGGTYLIAGDLIEGLGSMYIYYLAKEYNANLVLIGREGLPSQENWQQWLENDRDNLAYRAIARLQQLSESGINITFISSSLTDEKAIKSLVIEANNKFQQIDGVIHVGTMGDDYVCSLKSLTDSEIEKQLQTKVRGLITLDRIFFHTELDFFLVQSSLSSIVGGVGFAAYTAANIFMDTFVSLKNKEGKTPWFSINWDGYDREQLFNNNNNYNNTGLNLIDLAITPIEAWEITKKVLTSGIDRVIVSPTNLQPRIDKWIKPKNLIEIDKIMASTSLSNLANQKKADVTSEYLAPTNNVEEAVVKVMEELLGITNIGINDNFFELGGHSLLAIQIVSRLRDKFDVEIPMREFLFEAPTAGKIAGVISNKLASDTNSDEIETLLKQVENLSEEEIKEILKE